MKLLTPMTLALAFNAPLLHAAEPAAGADAGDLAKKLSNPVASLISVPFQFNYDEGFGPNDAGRTTLNVQPVIPMSLNEDWNLIVLKHGTSLVSASMAPHTQISPKPSKPLALAVLALAPINPHISSTWI